MLESFCSRISVVIPAKNEGNYLKSCLNSIVKTFGFDHAYEIIVVDNNSTDNTVEIANEYNCKVIRNNKIGASSSRNIGVSIAKGDLIAFIDADCIVHENWFQFLIEHFSDKRVIAVGSKICPNYDTATWVEKSWFSLNNRRGLGISDKADKVQWVGTSNMLVRKKAFNKVKGFNESLLTCEDYDLCKRLTEIGDILLDKRIYTVHLRESKNLRELFNRELWRGQYSLRNWMINGYKLYEAPSVLIPGMFIFCAFGGILSIFFNFKLSIAFLFVPLVCSLFMVVRSKKNITNHLLFMQCLVISSTYILARGISLVKEIVLIAVNFDRKTN